MRSTTALTSNEDLSNLQYSLIRDYNYPKWFQEVQYNGKTLSDKERRDTIIMIDETVDQFSKGLPLLQNELNAIIGQHDQFHELERTVTSILQFVLITMIDNMVAGKFFLIADRDYDRRFMRGKLMVILNEGFKRLYGFKEKTRKKSEWERLSSYMEQLPEILKQQYQVLSQLLDKHSKSSTWWQDVRNLETHLDTEKLYASRQEEVIESKVMMDSLKLFETLFAVNHFLSNVHAYILNVYLDKYYRGELKDE